MYKVGVCGHFGEGKMLLNGQTIKTKILTEELVKQIGKEKVATLDTHNWKSSPLKLLIKSYKLSLECKNITILPATRGIKVFVPLFLFLNRVFHRKLHYVVIGGWLPEMLQNNNRLKNKLSKFSGIYVETHAMIKALNMMGLNNVYFIPNFKSLKVLLDSEIVFPKKEPYKLCTFSRVMKEKGIEEAIEAVEEVNSEFNRIVYKLDIYGQIDLGYKERFEMFRKKFPSYISYKGIVPFDKSTEILKNYLALLFPTSYEGEGFPGTVIDAFSAGIPVIATDWKYNSEVIKHGESGFIYDREVNSLSEILKKILVQPNNILLMKKNCIKEVKKYEPEIVVKKFIDKLELD